jgi:hypothetical protein
VEATDPADAVAGSTPTGRSRQVGEAAAPAPAPRIRAPVSLGGVIAAVGGVVVVIGSLLETVKVGFGEGNLAGTTLSTSYFDTDNGKIVAALGALALVLALATLVRPMASMVPSIVVAACGLGAFGLALSDRIDLNDAGDAAREQFLRGNELRGVVHVTIGPALYFAMAGGVVVTIGAVFASRDR